jgi:hypothetical protein
MSIEVKLKRGKKRPSRIVKGQNSVIFIGQPPWWAEKTDLPFLDDFFEIKEQKPPETGEEKKEG